VVIDLGLGGYGDAGVGLGPFSVAIAGNLGLNVENPGGLYPYGGISPQFGLDWGLKLRAGAGIGGEIMLY
jgi:hypothetical protein